MDVSSWIKPALSAVLEWFPAECRKVLHERRQKKRLRAMLKDDRFPNGFRSIEQLTVGIGEDKKTTERLLLEVKARRSEVSDEWTLNPPLRTGK